MKTKSMAETWNKCNTDICDAQCCKHMTFEYWKPLSDDFIRFLELHGCTVKRVRERKAHELKIKTVVRMPIQCKMLKDNRCTIYENRPEWCRRTPNKESIFITKENCSVLNPKLRKNDKD